MTIEDIFNAGYAAGQENILASEVGIGRDPITKDQAFAQFMEDETAKAQAKLADTADTQHPSTIDDLEVGKPFFCMQGVPDGIVTRIMSFQEDGKSYRFVRVESPDGLVNTYDLADFEE